MRYIDPNRPIDQLRQEMIGLVEEIILVSSAPDCDFLKNEMLPLLKTNDDYLRSQARRIIKTAREAGIMTKVTQH